MGRILFVDDERDILKALERAFLVSDHLVYYAASAKEALKILQEHTIDILISDMRMPEEDGLSLLTTVKETYPKVTRILMSGYADEDTVIKAVASNLIKMYIFKPWDNEELIKDIGRIMQIKATLNKYELSTFVNYAESLSGSYQLYQKIQEAIKDGTALDKVVTMIEQDPGIASTILRVANSAFYRLKTDSIKKSIQYIGLNYISEIVLYAAISSMQKVPVTLLEERNKILQHTLRASQLYEATRAIFRDVEDYSPVVCLLHDLGKILLMEEFPGLYQYYLQELTPEKDQLVLEEEIFGIDHATLGALIADWWDLPLSIIEAIMYHHDQAIRERSLSVQLVYLANRLAHMEENGKVSFEFLQDLSLPEDKRKHLQQVVGGMLYEDSHRR